MCVIDENMQLIDGYIHVVNACDEEMHPLLRTHSEPDVHTASCDAVLYQPPSAESNMYRDVSGKRNLDRMNSAEALEHYIDDLNQTTHIEVPSSSGINATTNNPTESGFPGISSDHLLVAVCHDIYISDSEPHPKRLKGQ